MTTLDQNILVIGYIEFEKLWRLVWKTLATPAVGFLDFWTMHSQSFDF